MQCFLSCQLEVDILIRYGQMLIINDILSHPKLSLFLFQIVTEPIQDDRAEKKHHFPSAKMITCPLRCLLSDAPRSCSRVATFKSLFQLKTLFCIIIMLSSENSRTSIAGNIFFEISVTMCRSQCWSPFLRNIRRAFSNISFLEPFSSRRK